MDTLQYWRGLNRHERRRQARLSDFAVGSIAIVTPDWLIGRIAADAGFAHSMARWIDTMPGRRPPCLTCSAVFDDANAPQLWTIVHPDTRSWDAAIAGICAACSRVSDPMASAIAALRREGMTVRPVDPSAFSPQGGSA